jgi:DNA primase
LLSRYFQHAVIAYDGDGAGVSAAQRAIPLLEKAGLSVRVLRMRGAKDPDEFIKKFGREAFAKLLDESENHIDYRLEQIRRKYTLEDDTQRVEFLREATGLIASLHSAVEREVYGRHAAEMAGVSPEAVAQEVKKELGRRIRKEQKQQQRRDLAPATQLQPKQRGLRYENIRSARAEEGIIRLCLMDPALIREMESLSGGEFSSPLLGKVYECLKRRFNEGLSTQLSALTAELEPEEMDHLAHVASQPESASNSHRALQDYIALIRGEALRRQGTDQDELLRAAQKRYKEKKAYMEEKHEQ